jgi:hypothetical protein
MDDSIFQEYIKKEMRICDQDHPRSGVRFTHKSCLKEGGEKVEGGWTANSSEWRDDYVTVCGPTLFPEKNGAQDQSWF